VSGSETLAIFCGWPPLSSCRARAWTHFFPEAAVDPPTKTHPFALDTVPPAVAERLMVTVRHPARSDRLVVSYPPQDGANITAPSATAVVMLPHFMCASSSWRAARLRRPPDSRRYGSVTQVPLVPDASRSHT